MLVRPADIIRVQVCWQSVAVHKYSVPNITGSVSIGKAVFVLFFVVMVGYSFCRGRVGCLNVVRLL